MLNRLLTKVLIVLTVLTSLFTLTADARAEGKRFRPDKNRATRVTFDQMELEVPAGAAEEELFVEWGDPDLTGIRKPYGFRMIGRPYQFGPHGQEFAKDKPLKATIKVERNDLTKAEQSKIIRLFYINREEMRLEEVKHKYDRNTGILQANISHFSDYVLGITAGWDGNGINPFFDISNGEETVSTTSLSLSIRSTVLSLPGRGLNFNLIRASSENPIEALKISDNWYWDLPYVDGRYVNIPGKGGFALSEGDYKGGTSNAYTIYNNSGAYYATNNPDDVPVVYLKDGTKIEAANYGLTSIRVIDPNGNWFKYDFLHIGDSESTEYDRLCTLWDSLGRVFQFSYDTNGNLTKVTQTLKSGQKKTILTWDGVSFTDALGRVTSYTQNSQKYITKITYPNGAISEYSYYGDRVSQQRFYQPNQTQPTRVVDYSQEDLSGGYGHLNMVNDGTKIKKYLCKFYNYI